MSRAEQIAQLKRSLTPEQIAAHAMLFADYANGVGFPWNRVLELVGESNHSAPCDLLEMRARSAREEALAVLGLRDSATEWQIKSAYRRLAAEHHPDRGGDVTTMQQINQAYSLLMKGQK
jgi:DnaJ-domain-containing protein 1